MHPGKSGRYSCLCIDNNNEELAHSVNFDMTPMSDGAEKVEVVMAKNDKDSLPQANESVVVV
jgi:hypothetical protein